MVRPGGQAVGVRRWSRVHVVIYEHVFGPVMPGYELHHRCGQKDCHEPLHLVELTKGEHMQAHLKTHCPQGHEFTPENTWVSKRDGHRQCRTCARERMRATRRSRRLPG